MARSLRSPVVLAGAVLGACAAAFLPSAPAGAAEVIPVQAGFRCPDLAQFGGTGPWEGLYVAELPAPGGSATVSEGATTISFTVSADSFSVTWTSNTPMDAVFANAGEPPLTPNASTVTLYVPPGPPATGGTVAGVGSATRIDHLRFCWSTQVTTTTPTTVPPTTAPETTSGTTPPTTGTTPTSPPPTGTSPEPPVTTGGVPTTPATTPPGGSGATLPATGTGGSSGGVVLGAAAVLAGAALVLAGRRRVA